MVPLLVWVGCLAIADGARLSTAPLFGAPILADASTQADNGKINVNNRPSNADFNYTTPFLYDDIYNDEQNIEDTTDTPFENESSTTKDDTNRDDETDRNINHGFGQIGSGFINDYFTTPAQREKVPSNTINADSDRESKRVIESKTVVTERNIKRFYEHLVKPNKKPNYTFDDVNDDADRITERSNQRFGNAVKSKPNKWNSNTFDKSSNEEHPKSHPYAHDEDDKNVNEWTEHVTERNNKRFSNGNKTKRKKRNLGNSNDDEYSKSNENVDAVNDRRVSELEDHVAEWNTKRLGYGGNSSPNKKNGNAFGASNDNKYPISAENVNVNRKVIESDDHVTGRDNKRLYNSLQNDSNDRNDNSNDNDSKILPFDNSDEDYNDRIYNKYKDQFYKSHIPSSQYPKQEIPGSNIHLHVHIYNKGTNNSRRQDTNDGNISPAIDSQESKDDFSVKHYNNENSRKTKRISHSRDKIKANTEGKSLKSCKQCHFKIYKTSHHYSNKENIPRAHRYYHVTKYDTSRKHYHDDSRTHIRKSRTEPRNNRHRRRYKKSKVNGCNHHHDKRTKGKNSNKYYSESIGNHGYWNHHKCNSFRHNKPKNHHYSSSNRNHCYWNHYKRDSFRHKHRKYKKHNIYNMHHKYKGNNFKIWKSYRTPRKYVNRRNY